MRRRTEYLISKRDGRRQWLRATKLARSIAAALGPVGGDAVADDPQEVALGLTSVVLEALRRRRQMVAFAREDGEPWLSTADLASAVERTLWVSGRPDAAVRFAAVRDQRVGRVAALRSERYGFDGVALRPRERITHHRAVGYDRN